ncbi:MAG: universal stress protein [Candidatus Rokubacteria bacterium]|nr:universal stress protein [Candidatus Rokubacteria bacterium]
MAKRILVPVDFTDATDAIVPLVAGLAAGAGATVRLLHVAPAPHSLVSDDGLVIAYLDQEAARLEADALDRLHVVEAQLGEVPVESVVRFGDVARAVLAEAEEFGADLVALTTHARRRLGDVAARVVKAAPRLPVLMLRAGT